MATSISNFDASGAIRIEVDGASGASTYGNEFARAVQQLAATIAALVAQMSAEQRPQELNLTCGLKALPSGGFAVSLGSATGNFTLSLTWRADGEQGILGGGAAQPETEFGL
jgi:hypothetical protein